MNVYMRRIGVAGVLIVRVSYPAILVLSLTRDDDDWQFATSST